MSWDVDRPQGCLAARLWDPVVQVAERWADYVPHSTGQLDASLSGAQT